ncbi:hypothetical protein LOTGIDRAFT_118400 [Lottia gigantea]|uniref:Tartrate-resistant acid phosphatase type 5 n=1 Tax=Lottia gigantea TaxID=225164 RepID=V3ZT25_LOTGI|nr:hypothetical protein LOTGIDRAFT_118400 [Lottia gigantea]ESO94598.1 hypothetical protein LOTGIDRAFT_118400 [Lottia gigantea]
MPQNYCQFSVAANDINTNPLLPKDRSDVKQDTPHQDSHDFQDTTDKTLRFLILGDWGGTDHHPYTVHNQLAVAHQMKETARSEKPKFILALGDNFYYNGVKNVEDHRFKDTFEHVYTDSSLFVPWYVIAGNHDWRGNVSAQIAYTKKSTRWKYPYYYYPLTFTIPGTQDTFDIIMTDSEILCGHVMDDFHDTEPEEPNDYDFAENHWSWIESHLANSKAKYLFVAGHFPIYSIAEHGPSKCLVSRLLPMMYKYKVNGYFNGHDHDLQHLRTELNGHVIDYIGSGSGRFVNPSTKHRHYVPRGSSLFQYGDTHHRGGFALAEINSQKATFTFIRADGHKLYETHNYARNV